MKKRNFLWSVLVVMMTTMFSICLVACGGGDDDDVLDPTPTPPTPTESVSVSPTSVSLLSTEGSATTISITSNSSWTISGCPDWLHMTATSGQGNTSVTLTTKSENFSAQERSATLTVSTAASSATCVVKQDKYFSEGLDVSTLNMTIMSDGFACDLQFGPKTKGYKEAFFTESQLRTMTDRDIYNKLMEQTEYSESADYTFSPIVDPGTTIVYCIAAYGNENNADGSHKYGPMTMERITTTSPTVWADMYVTTNYNSTRWTGTAQKYGTYGTRCQKYYYFGSESVASTLWLYYNYAPYAALAHMYYKPIIADYPDDYAVSGQSFYYNRSGNEFFFGVWGIDDNNNYSAEHTASYIDLSSSVNIPMKVVKKPVDSSEWNQPRSMPTKAEVEKIRKSVKVMRVR